MVNIDDWPDDTAVPQPTAGAGVPRLRLVTATAGTRTIISILQHVKRRPRSPCFNRNSISAFLVITGFQVGAVLGMGFPSRSWTTIVGAVIGVVPFFLGIFLYERLSGRRSFDTYPPLQRLRQSRLD